VTIVNKSMVDGVNLTDSVVTYYTATDVRAVIQKATFTNDDTGIVTVTINLVPSGGSATYANRITKEHSIIGGDTWSCPDIVNHELEAGGFISMVASVTNKIGCRISGYEVT
jgi:hypothetical protein